MTGKSKTGAQKTGLPAAVAESGAVHPLRPPKKKAARRWLIGMAAGQAIFFAAALFTLPSFALPPAVALPILFMATLAGGLIGGYAEQRFRAPPVAAAATPLRQYIFQAISETNRKLAEMFVDEEFNEAANSNTDRRKMKTKPELKIAAPTPPRMSGM